MRFGFVPQLEGERPREPRRNYELCIIYENAEGV